MCHGLRLETQTSNVTAQADGMLSVRESPRRLSATGCSAAIARFQHPRSRELSGNPRELACCDISDSAHKTSARNRQEELGGQRLGCAAIRARSLRPRGRDMCALVERRAGAYQRAFDYASVVSSASTTSAVRKLRTSRHERGAMAGRQVLQRGRECQPHGSSGLVVRLGAGAVSASPSSSTSGYGGCRALVESDRDDPVQLQLAYADRAGSRFGHPTGLGRLAHHRYFLWAALAAAITQPSAPRAPGGTRGGGCQPEPLRDAAATQPAVHRCYPSSRTRAVVIVSGGLQNKQTSVSTRPPWRSPWPMTGPRHPARRHACRHHHLRPESDSARWAPLTTRVTSVAASSTSSSTARW